MEFSIKRTGRITDFLDEGMEPGQEIAVRGPFGNHFPVEDKLKGRDLLFIGGGIGMAPLRSVVNYLLDHRADYGNIDVVYGARSREDFVKYDELTEDWPNRPGCRCISPSTGRRRAGRAMWDSCRPFSGIWPLRRTRPCASAARPS